MGPRQLAGLDSLASREGGEEVVSQCCLEQLGVAQAASEVGSEEEEQLCGPRSSVQDP